MLVAVVSVYNIWRAMKKTVFNVGNISVLTMMISDA